MQSTLQDETFCEIRGDYISRNFVPYSTREMCGLEKVPRPPLKTKTLILTK